MPKRLLILFTIVFSTTVWGHGGKDPLDELQKNRNRLAAEQQAFLQLKSNEERIDSVTSQLDYLQKNILILRDLMTREYPHVKEKMSKYKLDYIGVLNDSLKKFRLCVKQASQVIE